MSATKPPTNSSKPPAGKPPAKLIKPVAKAAPGAVGQHTPKSFSVGQWTDEGEGQKIVAYAKSGMGKTTLASMAPNPVFIGVDDGARKILNPKTGEPVNAVHGVLTYQDVRDALGQDSLFPKGCTIVIDTITKVEALAEAHVVATVPLEKGGQAKNIEHFGFGKGYRHVFDAMRNILTDLDHQVRRGCNVLLLAQLSQASIANAEGIDYLEDGPKLTLNKQNLSRTEFCEWSDYVLRIGFLDVRVEARADARVGKVAQNATTQRAVFTGGAQHFVAKARPVNGYRIPDVVSFDDPSDDSIWDFIFRGARLEEPAA